jgi:hypothetical protein
LDDPAQNLVVNGSALASGWTTSGTCFGTNAAATYAGLPFSRISNVMGGNMARSLTFLTDGVKTCVWLVHTDGNVGASTVYLNDDIAGTSRLHIAYAVASDGSVIASAVVGTVVRCVLITQGIYAIVGQSTTVTAAHGHSIYANVSGSATLSSILMGGITAYDAVVDATLTGLDGTTGVITNVSPVPSSDPNSGLPVSRSVVRYAKNFTPMSASELAGIVSDAERVLFIKDILDAGTATDSTVVAAHPLSVQRVDDSLLTDATDAMTEATRRQALYGAERRWVDVEVLFTDVTAAIELGDVVEVVSSRFLLGAGTRFRVLGIRPDASSGRITLQCWK